jgi:precorrin-6B C5,15-methyltransferase / cobalt-precorrin-6B C5,C15-methyltransferase
VAAAPGTDTVTVIGVGVGGREDLSAARAREVLAADLLCASARHQEQFPEFAGERLVIASNVKEVAAACEAGIGRRRVVVLGTGDPNFFGIGRYLAGRLGPERLRILPAPSTMQEAFARLGLPWHEARFGSCHGRPIDGIVDLVRRSPVVGLFTDPENTPARVARALLDAGLVGVTAHVCCRLGEKDESRFTGDLETLARTDLPDPNVVVLTQAAPEPRRMRLGLPEEDFVHRKPKVGLITKREVRAVAIAKLALAEDAVVWDIGAGSGSVAVECALLCPRGRVFAVEKNDEDIENVRANIQRFGTRNVTAVHATAPDGLEALPDPDAVFVGGSGKRMDALLEVCLRRLRPGGRLVVSLATLDNLAAAHGYFNARGIQVEVTQLQVARGVPILDMTRLEALNPVTLMVAGPPGPGEPRAPAALG